jgi:hypothetical protein
VLDGFKALLLDGSNTEQVPTTQFRTNAACQQTEKTVPGHAPDHPTEKEEQQLSFEELLLNLGSLSDGTMTTGDLEAINGAMRPWLRSFFADVKEEARKFDSFEEGQIREWVKEAGKKPLQTPKIVALVSRAIEFSILGWFFLFILF